ncbi:chaplin family protein [Asanoa hainanensis]|nr:chaplin family protein [Asanoa hainanensis]
MAAGGLLITQAAASADVISNGNFGVGNGTQLYAPIQTVADICGNSIAGVGGAAFAQCDGGAAAVNGGGSNFITSNNFGVGNGSQVITPVQTVLDVCGNAIGAAASAAFAACDGGALAVNGAGESDDNDGGYRKHHDADEALKMAEGKSKKHKKGRGAWDDQATNVISSGNYGVLNGTQVYAPIQTSINICGNAIPLVGAAAFASCDGGAAAVNESARAEGGDYDGRGHDGRGHRGSRGDGGGTLVFTGGNYGVGNGTQVFAPIQTVIDICGNGIAAAGGAAFAACDGGAAAVNESAREEANVISTGNYGVGNGTQAYAPVQTVLDVCGNGIAGAAAAAFAQCDGGAIALNESARAEGARDEALPVLGSLPVVAGLPVVGSLGQNTAPAAAPKMDTAPGARSGATEGDDYDNDRRHGKHGKKNGHRGSVASNGGTNVITTGNYGVANGTQVYAPVQTVIDISGNAIAAAGGAAFAQSQGGALALN